MKKIYEVRFMMLHIHDSALLEIAIKGTLEMAKFYTFI